MLLKALKGVNIHKKKCTKNAPFSILEREKRERKKKNIRLFPTFSGKKKTEQRKLIFSKNYPENTLLKPAAGTDQDTKIKKASPNL